MPNPPRGRPPAATREELCLMPSFPHAMWELHSLAHREHITVPIIVQRLAHEPWLARLVFEQACQPLYSRRRMPGCLQEAGLRLGMTRLDDLIVEAGTRVALYAAWDDEWRDACCRSASAVAHLSRFLGTHLGVPHPDAFLAGILHNVGEVCVRRTETSRLGPTEAHREGARIVSNVLAHLPLSAEVRTAVRSVYEEPPELDRFSAVLHLALYLHRRVDGPAMPRVLVPEKALEALQLVPSDVGPLCTAAQRIHEGLRSLRRHEENHHAA